MTETPELALITGAGSGIGGATAATLASRGVNLALVDRDGAAAEEVAGQIAATGVRTVGLVADVASEGDVSVAFEAARRTHGRPPDIVANIAGVGHSGRGLDTSVSDWDRVFAVNARGVFLCCREALRTMVPRRQGVIVNMASVAGLVGLNQRAAYCASKGAVIALTRALAVEHARDGIRVNAVCPGTVATPWVERLVVNAGESLEALAARQPIGRLGTAEEVAEVVAFLVSAASGFMTGSVVVADGGLTAA